MASGTQPEQFLNESQWSYNCCVLCNKAVPPDMMKEHIKTVCTKKNKIDFSYKAGFLCECNPDIQCCSQYSLSQTPCINADFSTPVPVYLDSDTDRTLLQHPFWRETIEKMKSELANETRQLSKTCHDVIMTQVFAEVLSDIGDGKLCTKNLKSVISQKSICPSILSDNSNNLSSAQDILSAFDSQLHWYNLYLLHSFLLYLYKGDRNRPERFSCLSSLEQTVNKYLAGRRRIFASSQFENESEHGCALPLASSYIIMDEEWSRIPASDICKVSDRVQIAVGDNPWFCSPLKATIFETFTYARSENDTTFSIALPEVTDAPPFKVYVISGAQEVYVERPHMSHCRPPELEYSFATHEDGHYLFHNSPEIRSLLSPVVKPFHCNAGN